MTKPAFLLVLMSVAISAVAQLCLKIGMNAFIVPLSTVRPGEMFRALVLNPYLLGGLGLYGVGTILWLAVLSRIDLSVAYPFVALGFIMTLAFGVSILGESLTTAKLIGTTLIVLGVFLVGRG